MTLMNRWTQAALVTLLGLAGLFVASRHGDSNLYIIGVVIAIAAFGYNFYLIKDYYDDQDHKH